MYEPLHASLTDNLSDPNQTSKMLVVIQIQTVRHTDGIGWYFKSRLATVLKQVAQWATIAHHGASIMFGDTIIYDAQRQITELETVTRNYLKNVRYYAGSSYLQVLKSSE